MKDITTPAPPEEMRRLVQRCLENAAHVNYRQLTEYAHLTGEPITGEQITGEQITGEQITGEPPLCKGFVRKPQKKRSIKLFLRGSYYNDAPCGLKW